MRYKKAIKFIIGFDKRHDTNFKTFYTKNNEQVKNLAKRLKTDEIH